MPFSTRFIIGAVVALLVLAFVIAGPATCTSLFTAKKKAELAGRQNKATVESAKDAIATQGAANEREAANLEKERENEARITGAEGASDRANPAVRDAGLAALCMRDSFRRTETGRLRCPPPPGVEEGGRQR